MIDNQYALQVIAVMGAITFLLRAAPFLSKQWLSRFSLIEPLGRFLPPAIMTLLLVHSLFDSAKRNPHGPIYELLAAGLVIALQLKFCNTLVSIFAGTALYVGLLHFG